MDLIFSLCHTKVCARLPTFHRLILTLARLSQHTRCRVLEKHRCPSDCGQEPAERRVEWLDDQLPQHVRALSQAARGNGCQALQGSCHLRLIVSRFAPIFSRFLVCIPMTMQFNINRFHLQGSLTLDTIHDHLPYSQRFTEET